MEKIVITLGESSGKLAGRTSKDIQAAIDYVSYLGGGTVRLGEGAYFMDSTIHLRSHVKLEGIPGQTVLIQGEEQVSALQADADLHERQVTVENPELFPVGQTVTLRKSAASMGFGDTVAVIIGKDGNTLYLDRELHSTILLQDGGIATTQTPIISGYDCEQVEIRGFILEGQKNHSLADGCRNAGIFLFNARDALIEGCTIKNYNGDGISYQRGSNIRVKDCECIRNGGKGIHPGSGTIGTKIVNSRFMENGMDGIFLCWRVRESVIEHCTAVGNGMSGLSIGHKDTHNLIRCNRLSENRYYGIFFRNEPEPMAANYNRVEGNRIEDNGSDSMGYVGIRIRGYTHDVDLVENKISFSKAPSDLAIGVCLEDNTNEIRMRDNEYVNCSLPTHSHWLPTGQNQGGL